jgi:hypothetical protein
MSFDFSKLFLDSNKMSFDFIFFKPRFRKQNPEYAKMKPTPFYSERRRYLLL